MKPFEEYMEEEAFGKIALYKSLTGREPLEEELVEFLQSEYNDYLINKVNSSNNYEESINIE